MKGVCRRHKDARGESMRGLSVKKFTNNTKKMTEK